jgi:dTDP-4-amino-4,6-dideoxygalactose transaminase
MSANAVAMNALSRHVAPLVSKLSAAAAEVIGSGHFVLGRKLLAFEREFAEYCGVKNCVGVANGTDALEIALRSIGGRPDSVVAASANAAMYSSTAVLACGGSPVFVDVEPGLGTMDPQALVQALNANPGIQAVIVTHLYGRLAKIEYIVDFCRARGVRVIEDCAQAHGAERPDGRRAGSFGDVACFSFYPTKNLGALGDGGAVVTNDSVIAERARQLRQYGWSSKYTNSLPGGRNSRLDEIQAAFLSVFLPHLDSWNERRRQIAYRYSTEIESPCIDLPPAAGKEYVAHLYVVRCSQRDALVAHLAAEGVQTDVHYPIPDHRQPCHAGQFDDVRLPVTERDAMTVLSLPCFPELTDAEVQRVIDACNRF